MLYLIDIPRLDGQITPSPTSETRFSKDLCRFLSAAGVDDKMINSLSRYDFSATADVGFVYTMSVTRPPHLSHLRGHVHI